MAKEYNYKQIQKMREALLEETKESFGLLNVEHHKLVEMRVQTAIMAGLIDNDIDKEKNK